MNRIHPLTNDVAPLRAVPPLAALLAFERAASQHSFRRAARDLGLSPSAISHQIRGLEQRFGVRLFARGARTVRLTPAGERYLQSVGQALALLGDAGRDLVRQGAPRAELRVSSLPLFTSAVLLPSLAEFRRRHPDVTLRIEATHQYADFDASNVDVAIRFGRERASGLRLEPLLEVRRVAVCTPALARRLKRPADLAGQVLIHMTAQPRSWTNWLAEVGAPDVVGDGELWVDSVPAALDAAEQGLGIAIGLYPLLKGRPGFGRSLVLPFDPPTRTRDSFYFVTRSEQAKDRRITAFRRWLTGAVRRVAEA
jgi:LysR family glycine cleavage system transcriptional activator